MEEKKRQLLAQAKREFRQIHPCAKFKTLDECFTVVDGELMFWFNTGEGSTHLLFTELC